MKFNPEQLHTAAQQVTLDPAVKQAMKERLVHFMRAHQALEGVQIHLVSAKVPFWRRMLQPMPAMAGLLIIIIGGGGVTSAAQGALPDDALYSIKVNVNEKAKIWLAFSAEAKAEAESEIAQERLSEAAQLAAAGKLDEAVSTKLEGEIETHLNHAKGHLAKIQARGESDTAVNVSSKLEAALRAHQSVLASLDSEEAEDSAQIMAMGTGSAKVAPKASPVKSLEMKVSMFLGDIGKSRIEFESEVEHEKTETTPEKTAENKINAATKVIESSKALIEKKKADLGAEATVEAEAKLSQAQELLVEAKAQLTVSAHESFRLANRALRAAQEAKTLIETQTKIKKEFGIDVKVRLSEDNSGGDEDRSSGREDEHEDDHGEEGGDDHTSTGTININGGGSVDLRLNR